jgi:uncharacterized protein YndB with AHSA1/START domain
MPATKSTKTHALTITRTYDASPERLFKAWTDPKALKAFHIPAEGFTVPTAEVDLRVGGAFRIVMKGPDGANHVAIGTYREITPPAKLVYTWNGEPGSASCSQDQGETLVTLVFKKKGKGTELTLTHELFKDAAAKTNHEQGWTGILESLASFKA